MKIVNIIGGLGNQMFQYAFALALKERFPDESVLINTSCYNSYNLHNGFELENIFHIEIGRATIKQLISVAYPWFNYRTWQIGTRILPRRKQMSWDTDFDNIHFRYDSVSDKHYFDGYWQSPKFFDKYRNKIISTYRFPEILDDKNKKSIDFLIHNKTAFIHVRRGDYINHPLYKGICDETYYVNGIQLLKKKYGFSNFYVFSNDIEWCKNNIGVYLNRSNTIYVDWNKAENSFRDMQLMSKCRAALIANSSFSWWGAWLGEMEVVLCPDRWINKPGLMLDICPDNWVRIP